MGIFNLKNSLFWRLSFTFLLLFLILGLAYIFITTVAAKRYFDETTQKLNADVAEQLVKEIDPFEDDKVREEAVGKLMHSMMAVNPSIEVYLLDKNGEILKYVVLKKDVKLTRVSLDPIHQFIESDGSSYILGDDPRNPGKQAIFSATKVTQDDQLQGYVYIILAGKKYEDIASTLMGSYWLRVGTRSFVITLIAAFLLGLILIAILTKNLRVIIDTVSRFRRGEMKARVPEKNTKGELAVLARTFNRMADTILHNIDELKKVDQLRRELIANVSHDLRSPLAVIHGYIETLMIKEETLTHEERSKYLQIVLDSSDKLKHLVSDLFELSKLESGQVKADQEPFFVSELLQDASQKFSILADKKNITLKTKIDQALPMVYADISLIDRVVQNLLDNAIKYTPEEGWINLNVNRENGNVKIHIENSGEGIPEKDIETIFDRYFKVDKEKSKIEGTGLGLAIVKKILDLHNSNIQVKSVPNRSTIFTFNLPVYSG